MANNNCSQFNFETITCTQVNIGFDFSISLSFIDSTGSAVDLTNDTFVLIIKDALSGATLLTLNEVGTNLLTGLFIPSPTSGIMNIQITDTDTSSIAVGQFPYEMTRTDSDSKVFVSMQGTMQFFDRGF